MTGPCQGDVKYCKLCAGRIRELCFIFGISASDVEGDMQAEGEKKSGTCRASAR